MNDKLIFAVSAYLLFALFLTIHLFTANMMAGVVAFFFGLSLIVNIVFNYKDTLQALLLDLINHFSRIVKYFSVR
jgi:hypothetical protein